MKFTVNSTVLNNAIAVATKIINSKKPVAILSSILFYKNGDELTLTASDGENTITCSVPIVEMDGDVNFTIEGKYIQDAVKNFADTPLSFEIEGKFDTNNNIVKIVYPNGGFTLPVSNGTQYPSFEGVEDDADEVLVDTKALSEAIARTICSTDNSEIHPVMNGIYFDFGDTLTLAATDGHRLVTNRLTKVEKGEHTTNFILNKKTGNILKNILTNTEGNVSVRCNSTKAMFCFGEYQVISRLIEGRYPNYKSVIPDDNIFKVTVDRNSLISSLKRVLPFSSSNSQLVNFDIQDNALTLKTKDSDYSSAATENISCESDCNMTIGFNGVELLELINTLNSEKVNILLRNRSSAAVITPLEPDENHDVTVLAMPMIID